MRKKNLNWKLDVEIIYLHTFERFKRKERKSTFEKQPPINHLLTPLYVYYDEK